MNIKNLINPKAEISIFFEYQKPPYGGGNQFLLALRKAMGKKGYRVLNNKVTKNTKAVLFNSFNFDFELLKSIKEKYPNIKMVHRVDGPIGAYRGFDDGTDEKLYQLNHQISDITIFQSRYSLDKHIELKMNFKKPVVIVNAPDQTIFNTKNRKPPFKSGEKIKIIATSWSDNKNKGADIYKFLDENLDFSKYEFTFLGRIQEELKNITLLPPEDSLGVANHLKNADIYITASKFDPCSNALLEALSCGIPAVFRNSGGHPELVKDGGVAYEGTNDVIKAIEKLVSDYNRYQTAIKVKDIDEVSDMYLNVLL